MLKLEISDFDLDIKRELSVLVKIANKRFPHRSWFVQTTFWTDGDYRIELRSGYGGIDVFSYKKSSNEYRY